MSTTTDSTAIQPAPTGTSYIYGLADAEGRVRYVGRTGDPRTRLDGHLHQARHGSRTTPVYAWLRALDEPPALVVLQVVPTADATRAEREWILRLRATEDLAMPLLNIRPDRASAPMRRAKSREHRAAIAASLRRYYESNPRTAVCCPGCGRPYPGTRWLNGHLRVKPACRTVA